MRRPWRRIAANFALHWLFVASAFLPCSPQSADACGSAAGAACLRFQGPTNCFFVLWADAEGLLNNDKVVLAREIRLTAHCCDLWDDAGHMTGISFSIMEPGEFAFIDEYAEVRIARVGQPVEDWPSVGVIQVFRPNPGISVPVGVVLSRKN